MINNRSEYRLYKLKRLVHDGIIEGLDVQNKSNIIPIMHVSEKNSDYRFKNNNFDFRHTTTTTTTTEKERWG